MNTSKTLLQILVEELPKRGGFPIRSTKSVQDADGEIKFHADGYSLVFEKNRPGIWGSDTVNAWPDYTQQFTPDSLSIDYATAIITREQYEIALEFYRAHEGAKVENLRFVGGVLVGEFTPKRPAEHIHVGVKSGPLTQADFERAGITEVDDEADLNECMGQTPEDLDHLEIILLKEISYYAPEIGLGAATKIASGIVSAGYRKQ